MSNPTQTEHGDKRSVSTDALETLGMVHTRTEHRDAIHLAVEPVTAGQELQPGEHIGLDYDHKAYRARPGIKLVGIVDPFLAEPVQRDQRFWLVIYPRVVTSLRHVWSHPDFPDEAPEPLDEESTRKLAAILDDDYHRSQQWMESYLEELNKKVEKYGEGDSPVTMEELMRVAESQLDGGWGDYLSRGGAFEGYHVPDEFWEHLERIRGHAIPSSQRNSFLSCSC